MKIIEWIAYCMIFLSPFIFIPLAWKLVPGRKWIRILAGILISLLMSGIFYFIAIGIIFRNGMGP